MLHEQPDRAPSRAPDRANEAVPLFVDVDGTLTRADISLESFVRIGRSSIAALKIGRAHSELQSLMRISYAVFCLKKKTEKQQEDKDIKKLIPINKRQ